MDPVRGSIVWSLVFFGVQILLVHWNRVKWGYRSNSSANATLVIFGMLCTLFAIQWAFGSP